MSYWNEDVEIEIDIDDIINDIPTNMLEEELAKRKKQMVSSLKTFQSEEKLRYNTVRVSIDPNDYDLIKQDEVTLDNFYISEIVSYMTAEGYSILCGKHVNNPYEISKYLYELPKDKFRDLICDVLGLGRCVSNEEIIKKIKTKL